jgi:branched-chain amino acid transport system permease protein
VLLARTRTGVGMRAIVDNRELLALHGAVPARLSMLSWAIGSSLAALAGILLVSEVSLDYIQLTLLVVNAYAAAMVGKLKNLPRTIIGAMVLGLLMQYYILFETKIQQAVKLSEAMTALLTGVRAALPTIFLFVVMLLLPLEKLRVGQVAGAAQVRVPSWRRAGIFGVLFIAIVGAMAMTQTTTNTARIGQSLAFSMIMLTLVLITGYGGDVSLAQMTFAGLGGLLVIKLFGGLVSPFSVLAAGLLVAIIGAIVAIPALRLRGLYLGLGTLAFAFAMDKLVFENSVWGFKLGGAGSFKRADVLGISLKSEPVFVVVMAVIFVLMAFVVLSVRRGRFGRLVLASRDSPAACGTLGLNITTTRVLLFSLSSGLAGAAGALFGGMFVEAGAPEFAMFQSLPLLLLAVVGGITSITGTLIGGFVIGFLPAVQQRFPALVGVAYLGIGVAAIGLGRDPNGIAGLLFRLGRLVTNRRDEPEPLAETDEDSDESAAPEEVGLVAAP